jgi:hypothetical protein
MLTWNIGIVVEDLYKLCGDKIIKDVAIKHHLSYGDILNRPERRPDVKEQFRI